MEAWLVRALNWVTARLRQWFALRRQRSSRQNWVIGTRVGPGTGGEAEPVVLTPSDRQKHLYLLGGSGAGKSTAFELLLRLHVQHGLGFALIDPHGDLTRAVMAYLLDESRRARETKGTLDLGRVYLVEPFRDDGVVGLDILHAEGMPLYTHVEGLIGVFRRLWASSGWGMRMETVWRHLLLALGLAGLTLAEAPAFLTDVAFRAWVLSHVPDEAVRAFWRQRYDRQSDAARAAIADPVLSRLDALLADPVVRCMLGQRENCLDLRRLMDRGDWLFFNLAKGQLPYTCDLLGSLTVAKMQAAALSRAAIPERERRPFSLFVDEFQSFQNDGFETILSEARKYRLGLALAHQHLNQISTVLQNAIFSCAATHLLFAVSPADQAIVARELSGDLSLGKELVHLPVGHALLHRRGQPAVRVRMLPVLTPPVDERELDRFMAELRRRHGRPRHVVEAEIRERLSLAQRSLARGSLGQERQGSRFRRLPPKRAGGSASIPSPESPMRPLIEADDG